MAHRNGNGTSFNIGVNDNLALLTPNNNSLNTPVSSVSKTDLLKQPPSPPMKRNRQDVSIRECSLNKFRRRLSFSPNVNENSTTAQVEIKKKNNQRTENDDDERCDKVRRTLSLSNDTRKSEGGEEGETLQQAVQQQQQQLKKRNLVTSKPLTSKERLRRL